MSNKARKGDPIVRFVAANKRVSTDSILKRFGREGEARLRVLQLKGEIELKGHQGRRLWTIPETRITGIESMTLTSEGIETTFRTKRAGGTSKLTHLAERTAMIVPDGKGGVEINHPEGTPHFFDRSEEAEAKRAELNIDGVLQPAPLTVEEIEKLAEAGRKGAEAGAAVEYVQIPADKLTVADVVRVVDEAAEEFIELHHPHPHDIVAVIPNEKVEEVIEEMSEEMKAKFFQAMERGATAGEAVRERFLAEKAKGQSWGFPPTEEE